MDKMIDADPERVEYLMKGLLHKPESLYRAQYLRTHPTRRGRESRVVDWYEWGPSLSILVAILNTLIRQNGGRSAESHTLKPPTERMIVRGGDILGMDTAMKAMG